VSANPSAADNKTQTRIATAVYILQAATFMTGLSFFLAPIVAYWALRKTRGTWLESHFRWQINTFWFALAGLALGIAAVSLAFQVGLMILSATSMWFVYRIGQGWTRLSRGQTIVGKSSSQAKTG
jgi:uncharacterized membrane protein